MIRFDQQKPVAGQLVRLQTPLGVVFATFERAGDDDCWAFQVEPDGVVDLSLCQPDDRWWPAGKQPRDLIPGEAELS